MNVAISATIGGIYEYPEKMFQPLCYESWGNIWALIDRVNMYYIPRDEILAGTVDIDEFDIVILPLGDDELINYGTGRTFLIATQDGPGYNMDTVVGFAEKFEFQKKLDKCDAILSTTHGGDEYLRLFTDTPVLNIPLGIDLSYFRPVRVAKYNVFTIYMGEVTESCYDDRPMSILPGAIARKIGARILTSIPPHQTSFNREIASMLIPAEFHEHVGLDNIAFNYLPKCHASVMIGQRSTFGRLINVSWAVGIPCVASRYQCQEMICPELTISHDEVEKIQRLFIQLRDDKQFYNHCRSEGLKNVKKISNESIANRVVNEIIPIVLENRSIHLEKPRLP